MPGLALLALPQPAVTADRPGVGFLVAHQGRGADYLVAGAWCGENELAPFIAVREQTDAGAWRWARSTESACVWDLDVVAFERDAYVATVLTESRADLDAYLAQRFSATSR